MNRTRILVCAGAAALALSAVGFVHLRKVNGRLQAQLRAVRAENAEVARRQNENAAVRQFVERARTDAEGARRELDTQIERARREVADREQQAQQRYEARITAQHAAEARLTQNRDLTKGPVLVENCGNAGRANPVDAFETLVWASIHGDDAAIAQLIALNRGARDRMQDLLAGLPEATRAKYPTPEQFAALYVADNLTNVAAVRVAKQTQPDPQHVVLQIARLDGKTTDVPMELGAGGWQVAIDDGAAKKIGRALVGTAPPTH